MLRPLALALLALALGSGCTLSHVTSVHANFEPGTSVSIKCKEYKKLVELTQGIREMEKYGWLPATVGYKHTYIIWGLALSSRMWVCFEKPTEGVAAAQPAAEGDEPAAATR